MKTSKAAPTLGQSPAPRPETSASKTKWWLEVLWWIWCLAGLSYFYYSQGFLTLLEQLWNQALG